MTLCHYASFSFIKYDKKRLKHVANINLEVLNFIIMTKSGQFALIGLFSKTREIKNLKKANKQVVKFDKPCNATILFLNNNTYQASTMRVYDDCIEVL